MKNLGFGPKYDKKEHFGEGSSILSALQMPWLLYSLHPWLLMDTSTQLLKRSGGASYRGQSLWGNGESASVM